jgi:sugar/nucleoside kinase (ribokinase family)
MIQFLALGNLTLDDVVTAHGRIAPAQLGGNGVYAAVGMHVWSENVALVGVAGSDFPVQWLDALADANIDITGIQRLDLTHQLRSRVFYFPDGRRTDVVAEARPFLPAGVEKILDLETEYTDMGSPHHRRMWPLFSPNPSLLKRQHLEAQSAHLAPGPLSNNRANAAHLKSESNGRMQLGLDWPWWDWDHDMIADRELLHHIDYLLPSQEELAMHAGPFPSATLPQLATKLLAYGPKALAVKQGGQGAQLFLRNTSEVRRVPAYPTNVVDPTGAGDAFCGGFMVGIALTGDPYEAALYGAVSASFLIEDFGALHALSVTPAMAQARLQTLQAEIASMA